MEDQNLDACFLFDKKHYVCSFVNITMFMCIIFHSTCIVLDLLIHLNFPFVSNYNNHNLRIYYGEFGYIRAVAQDKLAEFEGCTKNTTVAMPCF